ncbi:MAG TPA: MBL fold metallo-hydrolase [Candidatus Dormibacteraeota bacterium]|nr:MBL fold metallo-hydrolase [Candidatus Dormibacteraeota bacterium]
MEVTYFGMNCVRLTGKGVSIICDPYADLSAAKGSFDVILLSQDEGVTAPPGPGMIIDGPGEYEVKNCLITGVPATLHTEEEGNNSTIYSILIDGVRVLHLGNISPKLADSQIEAIGEVDVLTIPVGGHGLTLDATAAAEIISQLEPKYIIPTHYDDGKTKYSVAQDKLEVFLKEIGAHPEPVGKLKVVAKDLPLETTTIILEKA